MAEKLPEKRTDLLMSIPASTFSTVSEELQSQLLGCIEAGGEYL
jgi:hypothetical protein